jgi:amino acid transporter
MKTFVVTLLIVGVAVVVAVIGHRQKVTSAPAPMVESSPEQTQPEKVVAPASENVKSDSRTNGENKNGLGTVGFIFGMAGVVYGLAAIGQVSALKKEVEKLKSQIDPKS